MFIQNALHKLIIKAKAAKSLIPNIKLPTIPSTVTKKCSTSTNSREKKVQINSLKLKFIRFQIISLLCINKL